MNEKQVFAKNLTYHMARKGKTQTDLVDELGINKSTMSTWCSGTKMPRMGTIQILADYFGIMKSDLIEEKPPALAGGSFESLTKAEFELVSRFRDSSPQLQAAALAVLESAKSKG